MALLTQQQLLLRGKQRTDSRDPGTSGGFGSGQDLQRLPSGALSRPGLSTRVHGPISQSERLRGRAVRSLVQAHEVAQTGWELPALNLPPRSSP